jgi:hypothetical protein
MIYDRIFNTYVAYSKSRNSSVFGIRVIDIRMLEVENIDILSDEIYHTLMDMKVPHESATRASRMSSVKPCLMG